MDTPLKIFDCVATERKSQRGFHAVILQHGYQGKSGDMMMFRNMLALIHPEFVFLVARSNERNRILIYCRHGCRLAEEVSSFIRERRASAGPLRRLSFVGHSIGSLIVRAALRHPLLEPFMNNLHTFISLSSPHLGFMYAPGLVSTAMWFLRRFSKSRALEELSLSDAPDLESSILYKLAEGSSALKRFEHVGLFSSRQDNYSPSHSSRIELCAAAMKDTRPINDAYLRMLENLQKGLDPSKTVRVEVSHSGRQGMLSGAIGRDAHIRFIDSMDLTAFLIFAFKEWWAWS